MKTVTIYTDGGTARCAGHGQQAPSEGGLI